MPELYRVINNDQGIQIVLYPKSYICYWKEFEVPEFKLVSVNISKSVWNDCKDYFQQRCAFCDKESLKLVPDRIIPSAPDSDLNFICVCRSCRNARNNEDMLDFLRFGYTDLQVSKKLKNIALYQYYMSTKDKQAC